MSKAFDTVSHGILLGKKPLCLCLGLVYSSLELGKGTRGLAEAAGEAEGT